MAPHVGTSPEMTLLNRKGTSSAEKSELPPVPVKVTPQVSPASAGLNLKNFRSGDSVRNGHGLEPSNRKMIQPKNVIGFDHKRSETGWAGNRADLFGEAAHTGCMCQANTSEDGWTPSENEWRCLPCQANDNSGFNQCIGTRSIKKGRRRILHAA
jgi:hypothetical protein